MLNFRPVSFCKIALTIATVLCVNATLRAEPDEASSVTPEKDPVVKEHEKSFNLLRPYRPTNPFSTFSPKPKITVPPSAVQAAPKTKRNEELMDRQKNWIFASPDDQTASKKTDEAFGSDRFTFDPNKSKGMVNRFLTDPREKETAVPAEKKEDSLAPTFGLGAVNSEKERDSTTVTRPQPGTLLREDAPEKRFNGYGARESEAAEYFRAQSSASAERARQDKESRMKEFENLFGSRQSDEKSGGTALFGERNGADAKSGTATRTPFQTFNAGNSSSSSGPPRTAPRNSPGFGTAARPDVNSRVFGVSANPPPVVEPAKPLRQPAVLPIPKRHF